MNRKRGIAVVAGWLVFLGVWLPLRQSWRIVMDVAVDDTTDQELMAPILPGKRNPVVAQAGKNATSNQALPVGWSDLVREDTAHVLQTSIRYRYPKKLFEKATDVIFGVMSIPPNVQLRNAIRNSWGRHQSILFVVGGNWTQDLQQEFLQHQDVLWLDRPETYQGLTYKTFCFLQAVRQHAPDFQYVYKTDDDVYLNLDMLHKLIREFHHPPYLGKTLHMEIIRDPAMKWYTPEEEYPNATYFHPFNIGAAYAIASSVLNNNSCVARELERQSFLSLEDVSVGWVMHKCRIRYLYDGWQYHDNPWLYEFPKTFEEFQNNFVPSERTYKEVINLYEVKYPEVMQRHHVEFCLDHETSPNCAGVELSCARTTLQRSASCNFVQCGGGDFNELATNCESCPLFQLGKKIGTDSNLCGGDCHWCKFGFIGDGRDDGLSKRNIKEFQQHHFRCVPRSGPRCRTWKDVKASRDSL